MIWFNTKSNHINMLKSEENSELLEKENKLVKNVYNNIAHHFNVTRAYSWSWIENFKKKIKTTDFYADIGCGNGRNLRDKNCVGVDNSVELLKICREKYPLGKIIEGCITDIPIKDNKCDYVLCVAVLHHLMSFNRRLKALQELKRILKKGKNHRLLLSVWGKHQPDKTRRKFEYGDNIVKWNKFGEIHERYYYIFKMEELYLLFELTGFKIYSQLWDCGNEIFELYYE